ncbi:MAG: glycosyltransferase family 2 protein, partial [Anaerolineae bacterium]|nr:glycosyltransferase family 2 protein [Anaerolineae bacterium]
MPTDSNFVSLIIPAYNEQDGIASILTRALAVEASLQKELGLGLEVIVVDDGSHDRTASIVREYPNVTLIQHPCNRGYGAAIKT